MPALAKNPAVDYDRQRQNMIDGQVRPNKVTDERILAAMGVLPRENFVPGLAAASAYMDEDIAVAPGRYLLEPMIMARLMQALDIAADAKTLEIGCNTGYGTAVLLSLSKHVFAVDFDDGLLTKAAANLRALGLTASQVSSALAGGLPSHAPYDAIFVHGAVAEVPEAWGAQLAEGGRMAVVVNEGNRAATVGKARLYTRLNGALTYRELFDANVNTLPGFAPKQQFRF